MTLRARFEPTLNQILGFVDLSCTVVIHQGATTDKAATKYGKQEDFETMILLNLLLKFLTISSLFYNVTLNKFYVSKFIEVTLT